MFDVSVKKECMEHSSLTEIFGQNMFMHTPNLGIDLMKTNNKYSMSSSQLFRQIFFFWILSSTKFEVPHRKVNNFHLFFLNIKTLMK